MEEIQDQVLSATISPLEMFKMNYAQTSLDSYLFAKLIVNAIIDKGSTIIYGRYLHRKLPAHFAKYLGKIYEEVQIQEIRSYDPGETVESYLINWMEEDEPEKSTLDSWCPNSVQMNQITALTPKSHTMESLTSIAESYKSGKGRKNKRFSICNNAEHPLKKSGIKEEKTQKEVLHFKEEENNFYKIPGLEKQDEDDEESASLRKEREDQRRQKTIEIQQNKLRIQEEKEKVEKKKKIENQTKNKEYTFDYEGNPIFLTRTKVSKLPNNEYITTKFDLQNDLKVLKTLPEEPPTRPDNQENDSNKVSLSIVNKRESINKNDHQEPHFLPVAPNLNEILEVGAGVKVQIDTVVKEGREYKDQNKMRRDEYLKNMEDRKKDRFAYYKQLKDRVGTNVNTISEDEENEEAMKQRLLVSHLRKLENFGQFTEIEIHEREQFIQMLMEEALADPRLAFDEKKKREKILKKIEKRKEEEEEGKRANVIENRVSEYQRLPAIEPAKSSGERPSTTKHNLKPTKIQKVFDAYNLQLLENKWNNEKVTEAKPFPFSPKVPKVLTEIKSAQKSTTLGSQFFKEPRERVTVGQKKNLQIHFPILQSPKSTKNQTIKEVLPNVLLSSPISMNVKTVKAHSIHTPKKKLQGNSQDKHIIKK